MKLNRSLKRGDTGPDVRALKRALKAAGHGSRILLSTTKFGSGVDHELRAFQKKHHLQPDGVFGPATAAKLAPFFDEYGRSLLAAAPKETEQDRTYNRLLSYMQLMTAETPGYLWGAGHGIPLDRISPSQPLDCSSSTAKALHMVGLFPHDMAWVSGEFASSYGQSGKGRYFTVWANGEHVWTQLHKGRWWRFDTSPHGDGGRGPRLRRLPRFTSTFTPRHWPGY